MGQLITIPRTCAWVVWLLASALFAQESPDQEFLEKPVGIVLAGKGVRIEVPTFGTRLEALPGVLLFADDVLTNPGGGSIEFIFCADRTRRTLAAGETATVKPGAVPGSTVVGAGARDCLLPLIDRQPVASRKQDDLPPAPPPDETREKRILRLALEDRQHLIAEIDPVEQILRRDADDLLARIAHAVLLERYRLGPDARAEYLDIANHDQWRAATWARDKAHLRLPGEGETKAPSPGQTWALLLGVSQYDPNGKGVPNLYYAENDASTFARFLGKPRGGSIGQPNLHLLPQNTASDGLRVAIQHVLANAGKEDTVILFIAAHGVTAATRQDGTEEGFILTHESNPQLLQSSALSMSDLRGMVFAHLPHIRRVIVYVDVCRAGKIGDIRELNTINEKIRFSLGGESRKLGVFLASAPHQRAYEAEEYGGGHGAFTYFLLNGLNGAADRESPGNHDGMVTAVELVTYVARAVPEATLYNQNPDSSMMLLDATEPMSVITDREGIDLAAFLKPPDARLFGSGKFAVTTAQLLGARGHDGRPVQAGDTAGVLFDTALAAGNILPGPADSAFEIFQRMKSQANLPEQQIALLASRVRAALEDRGQKAILRYLQGDQVQQTEAEFRDAHQAFEAALRIAPYANYDTSRSWFCEGRANIYAKRYDEAVELLERSIRLDPTRPYAFNALGIAYLELAPRDARYLDSAIAAFVDAKARAPYWAYPRHNLALAYTERGRYADALREYDEAMKLARHYSYLPFNRGMLYQQLHLYGDAERSYRLAWELGDRLCKERGETAACPERAIPANGLGTIFAARKHAGKAMKKYQEAWSEQSDRRSPFYNAELARAIRHNQAELLASRLKKPAEAATFWQANLDEDENHLPSLIGLANLRATDPNGRQEAISLYRRVLKLQRDYLQAHLRIAGLLMAGGQAQEAIQELDPLMKSRPASAPLLAARGAALAAAGRRREAREAYTSALQFTVDAVERKAIRRALKSLPASAS